VLRVSPIGVTSAAGVIYWGYQCCGCHLLGLPVLRVSPIVVIPLLAPKGGVGVPNLAHFESILWPDPNLYLIILSAHTDPRYEAYLI
jgi:hypothetical protein